MHTKNISKLIMSFILISSITILLSFPATALGMSNDAKMMANLLNQSADEIDISYLDWDATYAHNVLDEFISGPLHYSQMNLSDIRSCILWSQDNKATKISITRFTDDETLNTLHTKLNNRIEGIGNLASHISDEEERAHILLRLIAETTTYDKNKPISHSPYGTLLCQQADCAGISTAYKLLCNASNIDCDVVSGVVYDENNKACSHAWNVVRINGEERYVDVTFSLTDKGRANTDWFLLSKDLMWWKKYYLDNELPLA